MTIIVTGKGDFHLLPRFVEGDFTHYELYLGTIDNSTPKQIQQLPHHIRIVSIHTPSSITVNGKPYPFDLGQQDPIGKAAFGALEQTIGLGKQTGAKVIVVHGASYNAFMESKEEAMRRLANRIRPLLQKLSEETKENPKLCFETDVLWHNLYYSRRALLTTKEDFQLLQTLLPQPLKITADFEHLSITFHFQRYLAHCGGEIVFLKKYSEIAQKKFELDCQEFIKNNFISLQREYKEYLKDFFTAFHDQIEHIHLNGSDCCNYLFHPKTVLPFVGEHLPLGFSEHGVSDKLDYSYIASLLSTLPKEKSIHAVLEIWRTEPEAFIACSRESKKFLEGSLELKTSTTKIAR